MQIWRYALAHEVQWVTLSVQGLLVPLAPLPLTAVRVGVGALVGWRLSNRAFAAARRQREVCPSGTGYNYFLACDTAERIIFTIVTGSGSGKLCWHSRGNDNDQENAGYVRESAGGSEQV